MPFTRILSLPLITDKEWVATFETLTSGDERHSPFRWQTRLFRRLLESDIPRAVDIPTGLGKTSVMAIWLIALAKGANLPRRLVYVVDRRAVVDQATRFAERLRSNMPAALAKDLRIGQGSGLPISTLRGGFADNRDWLEDPSKAAIIVGTVDMIGSRLLFAGYGVAMGMRPYHAGLLGVDTLVLLDESHLCLPFEALVRQTENGEIGAGAGSDTKPLRLVSLSATGRDQATLGEEGCLFALESEDRAEQKVRERLTAQKRLKVRKLTDRKGLSGRLADSAVQLATGKPPTRVLVYCDRREDAVEVKALIDKECKRKHRAGELVAGHKSELLVGERRVYERTTLEDWLDQHGFLGGPSRSPEAPTFLIATSAGEVGVDLNADHMVCDLVAFERIVQRLGRVNRRGGENRSAIVDVFAVRPSVKASASKALETFEAHLAPLCRLPCAEDGRRDASPSALVELKEKHRNLVDAATTPASLHPELTRPLLDAWSMTSLKQHEGRPEVAPWLRGWDEDDIPQTSVVWRRHLPYIRRGSETIPKATTVSDYFSVAKIHATERLDAKSGRVFDWLSERGARLGNRTEGNDPTANDIVAILLDRAGRHVASEKLNTLRQLAPPKNNKREWCMNGATLVLDSRIGGLRDGMLDEECELEVATADTDGAWRDTLADPAAETPRRLIGFLVEEVTAGEEEEGLTVPVLADWRHVRTFETHRGPNGAVQRGLAVFTSLEVPTNEDIPSVVSEPPSLRNHTERVEERARELARRLELPDEEADAIAHAARLHDEGKAANRWQDAANTPRHGRPYAKPPGGINWRLLEEYRHEFGSLIQAERSELPADIRDLVLHLIAAHHGRARPLLRSNGCEDGTPDQLRPKSAEVALRYARLQKRYGPWGLAWREAILRAADQWASRQPSSSHEDGHDG